MFLVYSLVLTRKIFSRVSQHDFPAFSYHRLLLKLLRCVHRKKKPTSSVGTGLISCEFDYFSPDIAFAICLSLLLLIDVFCNV
jgi:hypothetical protein